MVVQQAPRNDKRNQNLCQMKADHKGQTWTEKFVILPLPMSLAPHKTYKDMDDILEVLSVVGTLVRLGHYLLSTVWSDWEINNQSNKYIIQNFQ